MTQFSDNYLDSIDPDQNFHSVNSCEYYSLSDYNSFAIDTQSDSNLNLLNFNIRSFHSNSDSFEALLGSLNIKPKFIILTETWNRDSILNLCRLQNFVGFHEHRKINRGGGVSVFCEDGILCEKVGEFSGVEIHIEFCCVKVQLKNNYILLLGVYRPPSASKINFIEKLNFIINQKLFTDAFLVVIAGDMNLNANDSDCFFVNSYLNSLNSMFYISAIDKPTRFPADLNSSSPTAIDHIFINKLIPFKSGIINIDLSDHLPTFIHLYLGDILDRRDEKLKFSFRPYSKQNFDKFITKLNSINWNFVDLMDLDDAVENFLSVITTEYCKCFPLKTKIVKKENFEKPWLTSDLKNLVQEKSEYFELYRLGIISKSTNNKFKNKVNKIVRKAKDRFYLQKFNSTWHDKRGAWGVVKELMGQPTRNSNVSELIVDGISYENPIEISNEFNKFFSEIAQKLDRKIPVSTIDPLNFLPSILYNFKLFSISEAECIKIIKKLKNTKTNANSIPVRTFKSIVPFIIQPLTKLINKCFSSGYFPKCFKTGRVIQIFKSGLRTDPSNYRPITTLPYLSKIFETLMCNRLYSYFNKFSLFTSSQYGFRKDLSTCDALKNLTDGIYSSLNFKNHHINVSIDYSKAFDTVSHSILLKKLEKYGIRGNALRLFESYLSGRKQYVDLNGSCSTEREFTIGVPQGSCLGPLLFLIYVNDFPLVSSQLTSVLFADDTTVSCSHHSYENLVALMNSELIKIKNWTDSNRLTINISKTNAIVYSNRTILNPDNFPIILNNNPVNLVHESKFLGVVIDEKLNFAKHISQITNKISRNIGIFYRIRRFFPIKARLQFYYSFIYPYLSYCVIVWGATYNVHLNNLITMQKRMIRLIGDSSFLAHTTPLFYKFSLLKLEDIFRYNVSMYMYKNHQNSNFRVQHNYHTRFRNRPLSSYNRLTLSQHSVDFIGPNVWNDLPQSVRDSSSIPVFKSRTKNYLISKYQ